MKKIGFLAVTILLLVGCHKKGETYYNCSYIYKYKNLNIGSYVMWVCPKTTKTK